MLIQVPVERLQKGMYVQELDRPWTETDFEFQGFSLDSDEVIEKLQEACKFVFVNDMRSNLDRQGLEVLDRLTHGSGETHRKLSRASEIEEWHGSEHFEESMKRLRKLMDRIEKPIRELFEEVTERHQVQRSKITRLSIEIYRALEGNPKLGQWVAALQDPHGTLANHSQNVAILAVAFARHLGYPEQRVTLIGEGALLHDVGLVRVPRFVLQKPKALTMQEYRLVQLHPTYAKNCIGGYAHIPDEIIEIIELHHYRCDGSGYPQTHEKRVKDHVFVVAICDMYECMTSNRAYRAPMSPEEALVEIDRMSGKSLPDHLVQAFINFLGIYPRGNIVTLENGAIGVVVASSPDHRTRPVIRLLRPPKGAEGSLKARSDYFVDLSQFNVGRPQHAGWKITGTMHPSRLGFDLREVLKAS
ncbi:MAG: DUF3391 domain-containing protein [Gammaproteobacteria bacterium]|nr:DUF3391 domain-containing protein [Gammaproteobacteria bacterium]